MKRPSKSANEQASPNPGSNPTQDAGRVSVQRRLAGLVVMLKLLKFREVAGYSAQPELALGDAHQGAEAFERYFRHTLPYLRGGGGEVLWQRWKDPRLLPLFEAPLPLSIHGRRS